MQKESEFDRRSRLPVVITALALLLAGCARTQPVAYYQLSANIPVRTAAVEASPIDDRTIGIGPLRLREKLDRRQIVTRMDANRLHLSAGHRWVEPPAENISQVLRENLAILLKTERFHYYPWNRSTTMDYQLIVEVVRFEGEGYRAANLETIWSVRDGKGKTLLPPRRSVFRTETPSRDHQGLVKALSDTLALFSREISRELAILHPGMIASRKGTEE